ncbi:uncharacterized protein BDV17DRAFT_272456 [Aspergillus undulatus]|uniref:uncharacterized protein n=1 Tax=Aspergillus undulatus TaxID=1810928 RepID=UPI003CCD89ED
MLPWRDILEHAKDAEDALELVSPGNRPVNTVEFKGSGHVGHLAVDRERYRGPIFQSTN